MRPHDVYALYRLACDPVVRAQSITPDPPTWPQHREWFDTWLGNPRTLGFVILMDGIFAGWVWAKRVDEWATMTIHLHEGFRGYGLGSRALVDFTVEARKAWPLVQLRAYVKPGNTASQRAFLKAGYGKSGVVNGLQEFRQ